MKTYYPAYAESLFDSTAPNLSSVNVKAVGLTSAYMYSAAHDNYDDLTGVVAPSGNLGSKTIDDGSFDAANDSLGSPVLGSTITRVVYFHDTGTPSTSKLLAYTDEDASGGAISIATNGEAIALNFNADGIFGIPVET